MVLSATIRNEKGERLGKLALGATSFMGQHTGWLGVVGVELGGDLYKVTCQLEKMGRMMDTEEARPDTGA